MFTREDELPAYWNLLNEGDRQGYMVLRGMLKPVVMRATKSTVARKFAAIISEIKKYAVRGDENDWSRSLVCGMVWLGDCIGLSTRQLSKLIGKCKSSINSVFQALGYGTIPTTADHAKALVHIFPFMIDNCEEMRQWTIRARGVVGRSNSSLMYSVAERLRAENVVAQKLEVEAPAVEIVDRDSLELEQDGVMWDFLEAWTVDLFPLN
jgi:hypothetical protein